MTKIRLEVAIETADDAEAADQGGADRLELSSALALGGLTPSLGTFREVRSAAPLPVVVMIRPRAGGFVYSAREFQTMQRDVELYLPHSPQGFVFGILDENGNPDISRNGELLALCQPVPCIFHRAFDLCSNKEEAARELLASGFQRVLTSGGAPTATEGIPILARLQSQFGDRLGILPAGGVRANNVQELLKRTGCREVHGSYRSFDTERQPQTQSHQVRSCREQLDQFMLSSDAGASPQQ